MSKVVLFLCVWLGAAAAWRQSLSPRAEEFLRQGLRAQEKGDFAAAVQALEESDRSAPNQLAVQRPLLLAYLQAGRIEDALRLGRTAVERWPQDAEVHHFLGLANFKSGRNAEAREELVKAVKLTPDAFDSRLDLALVLLTLRDYVPASQQLEAAIKNHPQDPLCHVLLGRAYQNANRSQDAVHQFQTALALDPRLPLGHYHLGFAYESLGESERALSEYRREIAQNPNDGEVRYRYGHCLLDTGDWRSAISELQRATELNGKSADAYYDLGKALVMTGDFEKAIPALQRATELNQTDPSPHYLLARALERAGSKEAADVEWARFAELKKAHPPTGGMATGRPD